MRKAFRIASCLLAAVAAVATADEKAPRTLPGGWKLAWNDEFNGSKLDTSKWAYELGVIRNPGASQTYTKDCVEVKNGLLLLHSKARETRNANFRPGSGNWIGKIRTQPYASGSVTTRGVQEFTCPGRLEFRARIPKAKGVWPALWTMHVNQYGWPANGEIDILEHISQEPDTCYSIFRWGRNGGTEEQKVIRTTRIPDYSKEFHTYVLEWDEEVMRILIDDKEAGRVNVADATYPDGNNPLLTPCYIIMNTAIGGVGTWPEQPAADQYPVAFEIDYVRYYNKTGKVESKSGKGARKKDKKQERKPRVKKTN